MASETAFPTIKRNSIYEQVVEHLKQHIIANGLEPGDRLPTEAVLAEKLNVSRLSVREALKVLESLGVIQSKTRDGTRLQAPTLKPVADHLRFLADVQQVTLQEIAVAREMIECALMPIVVANAQEEDYERIEATLHAMEQAIEKDDLDEIILTDNNFHQALLKAGKNRAVEGFAVMLQEFFQHHRFLESALTQGMHKTSLASHRAIYEALRNGDAELATQHMREHFKVYKSSDV